MNGGARAVILGWGNATSSQLVLYERLYRGLGLTTACVIPDTLQGLVDPNAYARSLAPLAEELAAEGGAHPIVVQLFSDNGFIGWAALLDALHRSDGGRRAIGAMRAVVVDSAPGLWAVRGPIDFSRRFALGMTPALARRLNLGARERLPVLTPLLGLGFLGYQVLFRRSVRVLLSAGKRVAEQQPRCPHLFLYGEQDGLVPPSDVRAWIAKERAAGLDVEDAPFPTARHVALYPNDPRRYRSTITSFVQRALALRAVATPRR